MGGTYSEGPAPQGGKRYCKILPHFRTLFKGAACLVLQFAIRCFNNRVAGLCTIILLDLDPTFELKWTVISFGSRSNLLN